MDEGMVARARMRAQRIWGTGTGEATDVVRWLTAVQAQDFPVALWSLGQRTLAATRSDMRKLVDEGAILRTHVLRPTWHLVAREDLRWLMALSGPRVNAAVARRRDELGLDVKTMAKANDVVAAAVAVAPKTRSELGAILERKGIATDGQRLPHILMRAELDAVVTSGPMRGKDHTYALFDERVPVAADGPSGEDALVELARRYTAARSPVTAKDFAWWSGFPISQARRALSAVPSLLGQRAGDRTYLLSVRARGAPLKAPRADLVPAYDEVVISYKESRDVLFADGVRFDVLSSSDGFMHPILVNGHVAGRWRRPPAGSDVEMRLQRALTPAEQRALATAIRRYRRFDAR